ncbi:MAG: glycosyltransferase [Pseudomonadota bacterium]
MTCFYDFRLSGQGLDNIHFLFVRDRLPQNGDLESAFFEGLSALRRHPPRLDIGVVLRRVLGTSDAEIIVIVQNPALVLDQSFRARLLTAIAKLPDGDSWSIAGAGGLAPGGQRHLALYASQNPAIPEAGGQKPLVDVLPDLCIVNAAFAQEVLEKSTTAITDALEPILATEGYLAGRTARFVPQLAAGINGDLKPRDLDRLTKELGAHFADRLPGVTLSTLSGDVQVRAENVPDTAAFTIDLEASREDAIGAACDPLSISIIVRTQFTRAHLLRRLLTSLTRARLSEMVLEVVLASDAAPEICAAETDLLQRDFCNLPIRLAINDDAEGIPSRAANLLAGINEATTDYIAIVDDDDYVDLFAFETIRQALFDGSRPLIVVAAGVHDEIWEETPSGRWVLTSSTPRDGYSASGWRDMFGGVNRLPICSLLIPRQRLIKRLNDFRFRHDLSEDYALFLLVLTDPEVPAIAEIDHPFCHISIRGSENSVTMPDRRGWVGDITAFLSDLTQTSTVAGPGLWQLMTVAGGAPVESSAEAALNTALSKARRDLSLMKQENEALRRQLSKSKESA